MITNKTSDICIFFGNEKATVSVSATKGILTIQELAKDVEIGADNLSPEDIKNLPKVMVEFFELPTLYRFINKLQDVKTNFTDLNFENVFIFEEFDKNENIVGILSDENGLGEPKIIVISTLKMMFYKSQSIDVLLRSLKVIENNWRDTNGTYYLAC
jgi:hypothetical protein